ncbi:hypothetical protein N39L_03580 [Limnospira platensis NIES-39]|uniref:Transposase n=1 Tax=Limnospira platensis NIES-46 TaxID=1236695 RepID=A0A5M3T1H4_LIMPL|nr:hypothetical protein N39L_03580 [Arthrospira platensis NIES-39]GCE93523.1 hypothetical protein NIES46_15740 [Arthrospira platensis NIES-46]
MIVKLCKEMLRNVAKNFFWRGWWLFGLTCDIILHNGNSCKIFIYANTQLFNLSVNIVSLVARTCQPSALIWMNNFF